MNEQQLYYQILGEVVFGTAKQVLELRQENAQLREAVRTLTPPEAPTAQGKGTS